MRYNKRATVIRTVEFNTPLGLEEETVTETLPCYSQNISLDEAAGIYGGRLRETLKLHFQRQLEGVDRVFYEAKPYDVIATRKHRRTTVLYLERSGHYAK